MWNETVVDAVAQEQHVLAVKRGGKGDVKKIDDERGGGFGERRGRGGRAGLRRERGGEDGIFGGKVGALRVKGEKREDVERIAHIHEVPREESEGELEELFAAPVDEHILREALTEQRVRDGCALEMERHTLFGLLLDTAYAEAAPPLPLVVSFSWEVCFSSTEYCEVIISNDSEFAYTPNWG